MNSTTPPMHHTHITRIAALAIALTLTLATLAVPARRVPVTLTQPDGTTIAARLCGDETFHFYTDDLGNPLTLTSNGYYTKATQWEVANMRAEWKQRLDRRNAIRRQRAATRAAASPTGVQPAVAESSTQYIGKKKGLVILVEFLNLSMKTPNAREAFDAQFNQHGYNLNSHIGSVSDYFSDQSYGLFDLEFDVVGPVKVSREYSYYGQNNVFGEDMRPEEMVAEACQAISDQVDFSDYDWDGDGEVEQVVVVYAGYGEHAGAAKSTIWPHESMLGLKLLNIDNVTINTYAVSSELCDNKGTRLDGIGTACHEFSHCLGLPDTYDTTGYADHDMDVLDIMASGSYAGPLGWGEVPCGYTAYERNFAGWLNFIELNQPCQVENLPSVGDEPVAYIIRNDNYYNEYFTLENRQCNRWFTYMDTRKAQHGMMITHIDYDQTAWYENTVNDDEEHQRLMYVPAGGKYMTYSGLVPSLLFPGTTNVTAFTDDSHAQCGGKLFNAQSDGTYFLHKPITNITEKDGMIAFTFMGDDNNANSITTPDATTATTFYTLGGTPTPHPTNGINIVRKGEKTVKVMNGRQ